jgi:hypothetical protein
MRIVNISHKLGFRLLQSKMSHPLPGGYRSGRESNEGMQKLIFIF